jgi:hypothetical protein
MVKECAMNGFWTITVENIAMKQGIGVVLLKDGKILGGDASFFYEGSYQTGSDNSIKGTIITMHFAGDTMSAFGNVQKDDSFKIQIEGHRLTHDHIQASLIPEHAPDGQHLIVHLRRKADAP